MIELMDRTFQDFESAMPSKPQLVNMSFGPAFRFKEKDIYQALLQKLARAQSLVRGAKLLLENGFVQEQAILHRAMDETNEDIMFLVQAISSGTVTELHQRFLEAFWEEEIDESGKALTSAQKRPMIPRSKIHAYLANAQGAAVDPSTKKEVSRTISKAYSGFVHGASPHIMEMYGGTPPQFHTNGMLDTPRMEEYGCDFWNYAYRTFISHVAVAKAFGAAKHVEILGCHLDRFERNAGMRK